MPTPVHACVRPAEALPSWRVNPSEVGSAQSLIPGGRCRLPKKFREEKACP